MERVQAMSTTIVAVATEKGAFFLRSDASRRDWTVEGPALKGWKVSNILIDRRESSPTLYAAVGHFVYGPTVQISKDLGKTWEQQEHGPAFGENSTSKLKNIWTIVPGPADQPEVLYAGTDDAGLFISRDFGATWTELTGISEHESRSEWMGGAGGLCLHSILLHKDKPERIWVGISAVGVLRSDDGGATFQPRNEGMPIIIEGKEHKAIGSCVHSVVQVPDAPDHLYQQNHQGVLRSLDGGDHWERIETGLDSKFGFPMAMDPNDPERLYIVPQEADEYRIFKDGKPTVYRTTNGGQQWEPVRKGLPDNCFSGALRHAMATDTHESAGVYFGTSGGQIFYSIDGGEAWQSMPCNLPRILAVSAAVIDEA